jgi:MFS family permease
MNSISRILPCRAGLDGTFPSFLNLPDCIPMTVIQFALISSFIALGGMFGAIFASMAAGRWGRRRTMQFLNIPLFISPFILSFATNYPMLVIGRLLCGLGTGGNCVVVPMYLNEISPNAKRGFIGIFSAAGLSLGLALAGLMGYFFSLPPYWRLIFGFTILTSGIQTILLPLCVESPVYLSSLGRHEEARKVMHKMGSVELKSDEVQSSPIEEKPHVESAPSPTIMQFLFSSQYRPSMLALVSLHATQQLSGINALFASAFDILVLALSLDAAKLFYVVFAFYNLVVNILPGPLLERYGRRPLLLGSTFAMGFCSLLFFVGSEFHVKPLAVTGFVLAATVFSLGLSSIPFIMTGELVTSETIGVASLVALVVNTGCNVRISLVVPH